MINIKTPCYIVDEGLLKKNLEILKHVKDKTGCKILLAQKGFSMYSLYPLIRRYLDGTTASSLNEARLGFEEMGGEVHIFAPCYLPEEFDRLLYLCGHMVFNSFSQWKSYRARALERGISCGIRVNPEYSEITTELYNPCSINSRLGVRLEDFKEDELDGISGLHMHTMCEQNSDVLKRTADVLVERFGQFLPRMDWLNLGGGHHITRDDYDLVTLIDTINYLQDRFDVQVYLEPGEAVALNAGVLLGSVLDIVHGGETDIAILDVSAACHMPDVLEMPYRPNITGAGKPGEKPYVYRLGGNTCLAGDIIGDYSFAEPLKPGDVLEFLDMAHYTMVKNNTFNGINLPSIGIKRTSGEVEIIKSFGYKDFKERL